MTNVVDLAARLKLHETVRPFLTLLEAAPKIGEVLEAVLPQVTKEQQRALEWTLIDLMPGEGSEADRFPNGSEECNPEGLPKLPSLFHH